MSNSNCLEGFRCPECGSYEPFDIEVKTTVTVYDNGSGDMEHAEWDDDSQCTCVECGHMGIVGAFTSDSESKS
ncbi:hypothetical protein SAMN04488503_2278 [Humidesulfovibrio mexicanus]|uniref:Uncharacterized protein n=1 Tax=Humidesulfovibrio mexicanus TaxID=147047 RepID=A0A239AYX6_9BACT|nr:hypothetical protein [Humidesulfovibrio mexicanus]SNS00143.1 hypothetical protein SAMN04488503_2278 [Humidesulfovibrio mexicanus]